MKKLLNEIAEKITKIVDDSEHFNYINIKISLLYASAFLLIVPLFLDSVELKYRLLFLAGSVLLLLLLIALDFQTPSEERENSINTRKALTREFVEILKKEKQELQKEVQELRNENKALKNEFVSLREQVKQEREDIIGLRNEYSELQVQYASNLKKQSQRQMEAFRKNIDQKSQMINEKMDQLLRNPMINQPSLSYTPQIQQDHIIEIEEEDEDERIFRLIEKQENEGF